MPIVSSTYTPDGHQQEGGGRYVTELHTDDAGTVHRYEYLASAAWGATECTATMQARVLEINERLAAAEAAELLEQD